MIKQNQCLMQSRHPGAILREQIVEMGISIQEFSEHTGIPENIIGKIINEKCSVSAELAVKFERMTQISAHYWIKSQRDYNEFLSRKEFIPMTLLDGDKRYTYADCLSWPYKYRCEIINGVARELPPVNMAHGLVGMALMNLLHSYTGKCKQKCEVFFGIFDVRLPKNGETAHDKIDTVVQPDISIVCDSSKIDENGCCGAPDMIVEIISPATLKNDCVRKFLLYEEHGVKEYWMVHPNDNAITVFILQKNGKFSDGYVYEFKGKIPVHVLDNQLIDIEDVFKKNHV